MGYMEEHVSPLVATSHLLQNTLRSLCLHPNSQWVYAVFWRILPRNHPPPKWDREGLGTSYDRSRGNKRNWILVWEDGFCDFAAASSSVYANCELFQHNGQGLQPQLFFKMSHEIYNYGEGLIGEVAADHSHKWIHNEPINCHQETNFLSAWHNSAESHPRTWEAQFQCGIKTIALIALREGVIQLGGFQKVNEDQNYVVVLREKLSYIESIPGVLLPHPSSSSSSSLSCAYTQGSFQPQAEWFYEPYFNQTMSSLEALLCKLPSVVPPPTEPESQRCIELIGKQRVDLKEDIEDQQWN